MRKRKANDRKEKALYIKNPLARELVDQLCKRMGVTLGDAVIAALEDKVGKTARPLHRARLDPI